MEEKQEIKRRGGRREGAGRPKGDSRLYSFRAPGHLARGIEAQENKSEFICASIENELCARASRELGGLLSEHGEQHAGGSWSDSVSEVRELGRAPRETGRAPRETGRAPRETGRAPRETEGLVAAFRVAPLTLPYFDISVVAGFPVPLDNDEKSQDIDILRLLCPHPESSYLIRVRGDSMIDAGITSGDIVIVDKSKRTPEAREIAVCELNGEYTLKHLLEEDGQAWLVPANPDYPRIPITDGDSFNVWGTVTYIIHKARD